MASICPSFKWSGCPVFKWHSKTRPFDICPLFNHSNTKIARYSDPHCTLFSQLSFFAAYLKHAQHWWRGALWAVRQDGQEQVVPQAAQGHTPRGPPPKVQERKWVWGQTDGVWQWGGRDWLSACHATISRCKKTLAGGGSRSTPLKNKQWHLVIEWIKKIWLQSPFDSQAHLTRENSFESDSNVHFLLYKTVLNKNKFY